MDDEIEDIVGEVKYTDSQKTIASIAYSLDFTDITSSSRGDSEKHLSSGKNTYVIECDSEDSDAMSPLHECAIETLKPLYERLDYADTDLSSEITSNHHQSRQVTHYATTSYQTMTAKEIFTQTSKTIIELAETEGLMRRIIGNNNLETQTSFLSITENKTVEYTIESSNAPYHFTGKDFIQENCAITNNIQIEYPQGEESAPSGESSNEGSQVNFQGELGDTNDDIGDFQNSSLELENETTIYPVSETDNEIKTRASDVSNLHSVSSTEKVQIIDDDNFNKDVSKTKFYVFSEHSSNEEYEEFPSDIEEDSLMQDSPKKSQNEGELREKISEVENCLNGNFDRPDIQRFGMLTPLTEEGIKRDSLMDLTDHINNITDDSVLINDELLFTNDTGMKVKLLKGEEGDSFKLPPIRTKQLPIQNQSCPNSPQMLESKNSWELSSKILAAGESTLIRGKYPHPLKKRNQDDFHLPPISKDASSTHRSEPPRSTPTVGMTEPSQPICIKERIKELKVVAGRSKQPWSYKQPSRSQERNRGSSASSTVSPEGRRDLATIAHLGCEAICLELLERLRSTSWSVVVETLEELPVALNKFWGNITEMRIADMLRQVNVHVESPRPQVARTACSTVAAILKNTRYTKKPDFYETVALLLTKTGSYSRLVRRAANVALDTVVCAVDMSQALAALTVHGVDHKNGLVRCAAARLLVVCCALGGAGRKLLKARPPSAATARKQTLRALAVLLDDKSKQTREYAERLYAMLRQLPNFEAYYLTDVDLETASRHMKKYDHILGDLSNDAR